MGKYGQRDDVHQAKQATLRVLLSFVSSIPLYVIVLFLVFPPEARSVGLPSTLQTVPTLIMLFAMLIATLAVLILLPGRTAPERLAEQGFDAGRALQSLMTSYAVRGAIVEAVALVGLVLSFLNRQLHYFLIGGIYALVMLVWLLLRRAAEFDTFERHFTK